MTTQVVAYQLDDQTTARFEIEPLPGFRPVGPQEIVGRVREAVGPAVEAAKTVLDKVKEAPAGRAGTALRHQGQRWGELAGGEGGR